MTHLSPKEIIKIQIDIEYERMNLAIMPRERMECAERLAKLHNQLEVSDGRT